MAASFCKVASNLDSHPKISRAAHKGRELEDLHWYLDREISRLGKGR